MNDEAQKVLADMMQRALDGVDQAVEFGKAEIPVVVEQLLMWHMVESLVFFVMFSGLLITLIVFWLKMIPKIAREHEKGICDQKESIAYGVPIIGGTVSLFLLPAFFAGAACNLDWLKIWIAPKLYLLEYGASLVK